MNQDEKFEDEDQTYNNNNNICKSRLVLWVNEKKGQVFWICGCVLSDDGSR